MLRWVLGPVQSSFEKEEIQVDKVKAFLITPSAGHDIDLYPITFGKKKGQVNPMHVIFIIHLTYIETYSGPFTLFEKTGAACNLEVHGLFPAVEQIVFIPFLSQSTSCNMGSWKHASQVTESEKRVR